KAHDSFLGFIYKILFAGSLDDHYDSLQETIDMILASSLSNVDISSLSSDEIEEVAAQILENKTFPDLDIHWESLSLEQFKAAYSLKRFSRQSPSLNSLTKEQMPYIIKVQGINDFSLNEIEKNLSKIEPRFLKDLSYYNTPDLSLLSPE